MKTFWAYLFEFAFLPLYADGGAVSTPSKPVIRGRGNTERVNFIRNAALVPGGSQIFSDKFKMGHGWTTMWIHIAVSIVIGTGTTALSDGLLRYIKKVLFKTDRGELVCNLPGRALFYIATYIGRCRPQITTLAAASATYDVYLPLFFCDDFMVRPEDTILDTSRYKSCDLEIQLGTTADLFGTPGTSTATAIIDVDVERTYGALPEESKPLYFVSYDSRPPQDASVNPNIEFEKSSDLSIKRAYLFTGDTGTAGIPWSGNANDTYAQRTNIQDQERFIEKDRIHTFVQALNKTDQNLETVMAGVEVYDFVRDRTMFAALSTGDRSALQLALTQSGAAANSIMTMSTEGVRLLKA